MRLAHLTYTTLIPSIMKNGLIGMPSRHHRYLDDGSVVEVPYSGSLPAVLRPPAVWFMDREDTGLFVNNNLFHHPWDPPGDVRQIVEVDLAGYEPVESHTPFFDIYRVEIFAVFARRILPERITVIPRDENPSVYMTQLMRLGARVLYG